MGEPRRFQCRGADDYFEWEYGKFVLYSDYWPLRERIKELKAEKVRRDKMLAEALTKGGDLAARVQELKAEVKGLEDKIVSLEKENAELDKQISNLEGDVYERGTYDF